jgi:hypothetical protein
MSKFIKYFELGLKLFVAVFELLACLLAIICFWRGFFSASEMTAVKYLLIFISIELYLFAKASIKQKEDE